MCSWGFPSALKSIALSRKHECSLMFVNTSYPIPMSLTDDSTTQESWVFPHVCIVVYHLTSLIIVIRGLIATVTNMTIPSCLHIGASGKGTFLLSVFYCVGATSRTICVHRWISLVRALRLCLTYHAWVSKRNITILYMLLWRAFPHVYISRVPPPHGTPQAGIWSLLRMRVSPHVYML